MAGQEEAPKRQKLEHQKGSDHAINEAFMKAAAMSALAGVRIGHGGPFGAAIVRDGVVVSCAHNMVMYRKDPCCHAEMNAISQACRALGSHDLSDCDLYTTCEPCPMCWGAVQWSRLNKAYIGVDRNTAAKYGFDDKVFYEEIHHQSHNYGIDLFRVSCVHDKSSAPSDGGGGEAKKGTAQEKTMVEIFDGVLRDECRPLFTDPKINKTLKRRFNNPTGEKLQRVHEELFTATEQVHQTLPPSLNEEFMRRAIRCTKRGVLDGVSKEREPFSAVIVKDGQVISEACCSVLYDHDATATAEVNAIRAAARFLGTHNLEGCEMYSTAHPDLMSLGAILWARITRVYCGITQQYAAQCGFEEGMLHFRDLLETDRRVTEVIEGVAKDDCENVFREWSDRNGVVY